MVSTISNINVGLLRHNEIASAGNLHEHFDEYAGDHEEWLAVWVKSNFEKRVSLSIRARGLEDFLPTYIRNRWRHRNDPVREPLFSGYVFCKLPPHRRVDVLKIPGVVNFVGVGKHPLPVDERELEVIRKLIATSSSLCEWPYTEINQRVVIERGPLVGIEGVVVSGKNSSRVVVSITLLRRSVATEVDIACLRRL
jgi:transcription antitermination factor NusG